MAANSGRGQQVVGNPGDPIKLIFKAAVVQAIAMIQSLNKFDALTDLSRDESKRQKGQLSQDVYEFLFKTPTGQYFFNELSNDVRNSGAKHQWPILEEHPFPSRTACAWTNLSDRDPQIIVFSYQHCRQALSQYGTEYAPQILIHESTHHLGVVKGSVYKSDQEAEAFADKVTLQIYQFWQGKLNESLPKWKETSLVNAPAERYQHVGVKVSLSLDLDSEGSFIWGGCNFSKFPNRESCSEVLQSGHLYKPSDKQTAWRKINKVNQPEARRLAESGVIPGTQNTKVFVWGGCAEGSRRCKRYLADGSIYDTNLDSWTTIPNYERIEPRIYHSAIWTDGGLFVWGGLTSNSEVLGSGYFLNTSASEVGSTSQKSWQPVSLKNAPSPRYGHATFATDQGILIWGGCRKVGWDGTKCSVNPDNTKFFHAHSDGFVYRPQTNDWIKLPSLEESFSFTPRIDAAYALHKNLFVVWGGRTMGSKSLSDGAIYDFDTGAWTQISGLLPEGEMGRFHHKITFLDQNSLLVYGGVSYQGSPVTEIIKSSTLKLSWLENDIEQQYWEVINHSNNAPLGRKSHSQFLLNDNLWIWGGFGDDLSFLYTGGELTNLEK